MKLRKLTSICLVIALLLSSITTGCSKIEDSAKLSQDELVNLSKGGDFEGGGYVITEALNDLPQDYVFEIELGFDIDKVGINTFEEIFGIYEDSELTCMAGANCTYDIDTNIITIEPPINDNMAISKHFYSQKDEVLDRYVNDENDFYLFQTDERDRWGNCSKYYFVLYRDLDTGEELDKPEVTVCNMRGELDTPTNFRYSQTDMGEARFTWDAVEGAEKYLIVSYRLYTESIKYGDMENTIVYDSLSIEGISDKNEWVYEETGSGYCQNSIFTSYDSDQTYEELIEKRGKEVKRDFLTEELETSEYYGVIAISEKGSSVISNTYKKELLAKTLPNVQTLIVTEAADGEDKDKGYYYDTFEDLPSYMWIILCDGTAVQRIINYDIVEYKSGEREFIDFDEDGECVINVRDAVILNYTIEGTALYRTLGMCVLNYNETTLEEELQALKDRQDSLKTVGGNKDVRITIVDDEDDSASNEEVKDYNVTANSALTKYLSVNMVNSVESIDVSEFSEAKDENYLLDALYEGMYQNPLVLGIANIGLSRNGKILHLEYEENKQDRQAKQIEIQKEVTRVVKNIITDDMSDLEKENVINEYLCEIGEYDYDALENAEKYDFVEVDEEFYDSFTAYGILINGIGVCASYSSAFKLLCDEAGLECIVVTGYLEGSYSHAWNKVKIDGEWQIIDVTNNDNEDLYNALMNIPDYASDGVLVEDDRFVMDSCVNKYYSTTTDNEYYRVNDKYFDIEEIAKSLASELGTKNDVALRTEYSLNDKEFSQILKEVRQITGEKVYGYYWMGVIYMTKNIR